MATDSLDPNSLVQSIKDRLIAIVTTGRAIDESGDSLPFDQIQGMGALIWREADRLYFAVEDLREQLGLADGARESYEDEPAGEQADTADEPSAPLTADQPETTQNTLDRLEARLHEIEARRRARHQGFDLLRMEAYDGSLSYRLMTTDPMNLHGIDEHYLDPIDRGWIDEQEDAVKDAGDTSSADQEKRIAEAENRIDEAAHLANLCFGLVTNSALDDPESVAQGLNELVCKLNKAKEWLDEGDAK